MRWPLRRTPREMASSPGAPSQPAAPVTRDWPSLPPLEPALGPAPLVAPAPAFAAHVAGLRPLQRTLAPLAHAVTEEAPRGLLLLTPPVPDDRGAPLPPLRERTPRAQPEPAITEETPPPPTPRTLDTVEVDSNTPAPTASLTRFSGPLPLEGGPPAAIGESPRQPRAEPAPRVWEPPRTAPALVQRSANDRAQTGPLTGQVIIRRRPSLGQSRRLGIGMPFTPPPPPDPMAAPAVGTHDTPPAPDIASTVVQRVPSPPPVHSDPTTRASSQRAGADPQNLPSSIPISTTTQVLPAVSDPVAAGRRIDAESDSPGGSAQAPSQAIDVAVPLPPPAPSVMASPSSSPPTDAGSSPGAPSAVDLTIVQRQRPDRASSHLSPAPPSVQPRPATPAAALDGDDAPSLPLAIPHAPVGESTPGAHDDRPQGPDLSERGGAPGKPPPSIVAPQRTIADPARGSHPADVSRSVISTAALTPSRVASTPAVSAMAVVQRAPAADERPVAATARLKPTNALLHAVPERASRQSVAAPAVQARALDVWDTGSAIIDQERSTVVEPPAMEHSRLGPTIVAPAPLVQRIPLQQPIVETAPPLPLPPRTVTQAPAAEAQRTTETAPAEPVVVTPTVQRQAEEAVSSPVPSAGPAPGAPAGPSGGAHSAPGEMEELARRLYEHIGNRLRAELLVERERAGMVTDLR